MQATGNPPLKIILRKKGGQSLYTGTSKPTGMDIATKQGYQLQPGKKPTPTDDFLSLEVWAGKSSMIFWYFKQ